MKKVNLVEFAELISHAYTLGYDWNYACSFLDDLRPQYETKTITFNISDLEKAETTEDDDDFDLDDFDKVEYSDELIHTMKNFFEKHGIDEIVIV